jgi:polysaccharide deacetylase 2 family uncharacterized protein YibQ
MLLFQRFDLLTGNWRGWRGLKNAWLVLSMLVGVLISALVIAGPDKKIALDQNPGMSARRSDLGTARSQAELHSQSLGGSGLEMFGGARASAIEVGNPDVYPKIAILVSGIGLDEIQSESAIRLLPSAVTLAFSPYGRSSLSLLALAKESKHEYLLSVPMSPARFPLVDADEQRALMPSLLPKQNLDRLHLMMSKFSGYVGITDIMGSVRGSGLADESMRLVGDDISRRGLLYVSDEISQSVENGWNNYQVDVMIDDPPSAIDHHLTTLITTAKSTGVALGVVTLPRPTTLQHIRQWLQTLPSYGVALEPVSAVVHAKEHKSRE